MTKTINFLLVLLFHIKEAENDQQGQIGNGDEHANVEEGKKYTSSRCDHISPLHLCRFYLRYFSFLSLFNN